MSDISERIVVRCPSHEAPRHLAAFVGAHAVGNGAVRIPLRLPTTIFAERRALLERRVVATLYPLRAISDPYPTYSVTWKPEAVGPFPAFAGALAVEKTTLEDCFGLIMSGHYEPPLGVMGALFDVALGQRIARASARDLLRSIAGYVERARAHDRAARAGFASCPRVPPGFSARRPAQAGVNLRH